MPRKRRFKSSTTKKAVKAQGKIKHKKTEVDGIIFDSKMESDYYKKCKEDLENGKISRFELQPEFLLQEKFIKIDGTIIYGSDPDFNKLKRKTKAPTTQAIKYIADFKVTDLDGTVHIIDTKGKATADFEIKRKLFEAKFPMNLEVIIWDKQKNDWVDYYLYKKEERQAKKNKALKAS